MNSILVNHVWKSAVFVSIPKNASHTVRKVLGSDDPKSFILDENHLPLSMLRKKCAVDSLYTFCVVRNPYDRCVSWYSYHRQVEQLAPYDQMLFKDWVMQGMPHHWDWMPKTPLLQANFVEGGKLNCVIKLESIDSDLKWLMDTLGDLAPSSAQPCRYSNFPIPKLNAVERSHFREYYDKQTQDAVFKQLEPDFRLFQYPYEL